MGQHHRHVDDIAQDFVSMRAECQDSRPEIEQPESGDGGGEKRCGRLPMSQSVPERRARWGSRVNPTLGQLTLRVRTSCGMRIGHCKNYTLNDPSLILGRSKVLFR